MSESRAGYLTNQAAKVVAQNGNKCDTITVNRADLEQEHRLLIARLHLLRKQLGYAPLTDKEQQRQAAK
jgi:hypothetical protein